MTNRGTRFTHGRALLAGALVAAAAQPAGAQLDPLLFVKRVPPTVIIVMDTSRKMLEDGQGRHYDTNTFSVADDPAVASALGVDALAATYRRKFVGLDWDGVQDDNKKYIATDIIAVSNTSAEYSTFWDVTRFEIAKRGIASAVAGNDGIVRWGLVKLRQDRPFWRVTPNCDKPVNLSGHAVLGAATDVAPCSGGGTGKYGLYSPGIPTNGLANYAIETLQGGGAAVVSPAAGSGSSVVTMVSKPLLDSTGLIPASRGGQGYTDRPLTHALDDAKKMAQDAMAADAAATRSCRNTIVVLVTGGKDSGNSSYLSSHDISATASSFRSVSGGGVTRPVPIYVVAVKPAAAEETDLRTVATNSGGQYFNVTDADGVARAVNLAVQAGFSRAADFDTGAASEFTGVSPIIGTVNLKNAADASGTALTNTEIRKNDIPTEAIVPQRSNVLISAGFSLPGFDGKIRAFRTYRPVRDTTKVSGWRFDSAGTRLWPDLDSRPSLAGIARTPADSATRNIYTAIPNGAGGATVVAFTTANVTTLSPHLALPASTSATDFISWYRALPLGAVIGSTPALMDPPSLDPPPDSDYGRPDDSTLTFAATHKNRRALIFVGANDGMIHAIDARTGYELWAFIPYNLLPKLKALADGQPVEEFEYFVDSSPKIAEVKMNTAEGHRWRSLLIMGEGPGGTFYQAFDVTEAGMGVAPEQGSLTDVQTLLQTFDTPNESIQFLWAFPNYNSFDPAITATIPVSDVTPGGQAKFYGDLKSSATFAEKTVGFTWSDPAVGPLNQDRTTNVVMVGSGYFPAVETSTSLQRGGATAPAAGRTFYLLKVEDGTLLGNPTGGSCSGTGCFDVGDAVSPGIKNALQADPSAAGDNGVPIVKKAYLGDLDGNYWRFDFGVSGSVSASLMKATAQPIFGSSALLFIGSADVYMFFATGSDLLPTTSPYGVGTFKLYALKDNAPTGAGATEKFTYSLAAVTDVGGIANGERASTAPSVAGDIVFFTSTTESASNACSDFTGNLYAFTYLGGAAYDTSGNDRLDAGESPRIKQTPGRATAPFIVDQHLYFGTAGSTGFQIEMFGDPEDFNNGVGQVGIRLLSWREIR
ncbi:MAG: hypothetical protein HYU53_06320 [Acidobacteria bacterium]|nr:hypothetical protein [Acidobacteriota bacterium]